jgi:hypothetical protein
MALLERLVVCELCLDAHRAGDKLSTTRGRVPTYRTRAKYLSSDTLPDALPRGQSEASCNVLQSSRYRGSKEAVGLLPY